ncbi:MAG: hypothetical protein OHK93_001404 [Ramalina farinacea]|uniref:Uncharacterized protein n=1 Tax=Ramalina farinacea TaxID=258253 RepID=A0AA43QRH8_9LECA|nr:hypothetical protein [Ramalina farinacea]
MNQLNMPGMNPSMPGMGNMPMNNLPNGAMPRQMDDEETMETNEAKLNHWIYAYFLDKQQWDAARSLKNGSLRFEPPLGNADEEMNGVNEDSKSNINDIKRPADLPSAKGGHDAGSMLPSWFNLFWDMFEAQRGNKAASAGARQVIDHNRVQRTARDQQMYRAMSGMMPTPIDPNNMQQMLRMNGMNGDHLRQKAMQNQQQNGFRG